METKPTLEETQKNVTAFFDAINTICFIIGMIGVWLVTKNFAALLFTFIAAIHIRVTVVQDK